LARTSANRQQLASRPTNRNWQELAGLVGGGGLVVGRRRRPSPSSAGTRVGRPWRWVDAVDDGLMMDCSSCRWAKGRCRSGDGGQAGRQAEGRRRAQQDEEGKARPARPAQPSIPMSVVGSRYLVANLGPSSPAARRRIKLGFPRPTGLPSCLPLVLLFCCPVSRVRELETAPSRILLASSHPRTSHLAPSHPASNSAPASRQPNADPLAHVPSRGSHHHVAAGTLTREDQLHLSSAIAIGVGADAAERQHMLPPTRLSLP